MPSNLPIRCKHCGAAKADGVRISRNGKCGPCATARMSAALELQRAIGRGDRKAVAAAAKRLDGAAPHQGVGGARRAQKRAG